MSIIASWCLQIYLSLWFEGINTSVLTLPTYILTYYHTIQSAQLGVNLVNINMEAFVGSWRKDVATVSGAEALGKALGEFCYWMYSQEFSLKMIKITICIAFYRFLLFLFCYFFFMLKLHHRIILLTITLEARLKQIRMPNCVW